MTGQRWTAGLRTLVLTGALLCAIVLVPSGASAAVNVEVLSTGGGTSGPPSSWQRAKTLRRTSRTKKSRRPLLWAPLALNGPVSPARITVENIRQTYFTVDEERKFELLLRLMDRVRRSR